MSTGKATLEPVAVLLSALHISSATCCNPRVRIHTRFPEIHQHAFTEKDRTVPSTVQMTTYLRKNAVTTSMRVRLCITHMFRAGNIIWCGLSGREFHSLKKTFLKPNMQLLCNVAIGLVRSDLRETKTCSRKHTHTVLTLLFCHSPKPETARPSFNEYVAERAAVQTFHRTVLSTGQKILENTST